MAIDSAGCRGPGDFLGMRVCARQTRDLVENYNNLVCKNRPECMLDLSSTPEELNKIMPRYTQRWKLPTKRLFRTILRLFYSISSQHNNVSWFTARLSCQLQVAQAQGSPNMYHILFSNVYSMVFFANFSIFILTFFHCNSRFGEPCSSLECGFIGRRGWRRAGNSEFHSGKILNLWWVSYSLSW